MLEEEEEEKKKKSCRLLRGVRGVEIGNAETFLCRHTYPVDLSDCEKHGLFGSDGAGYELDVVRQSS